MERAEVYVENDQGSSERLLGDSKLEQSDKEEKTDEEEEEEEDVAKLMGFTDQDSDHSDNQRKEKKTKLKKSLSKLSAKRVSSEEVDGFGSVIPRVEPTPEDVKFPDVTSQRLPPTAILKRQAKMKKIYEKHTSQTSKILCGIYCIIVILGIGCGLLFIARTFGMKDLYIVGGIFTAGGLLFTISFIVLRCTVDRRKADSDYSALYKPPVE